MYVLFVYYVYIMCILMGYLMKLFKSLGFSSPKKHAISLRQYIAFILHFAIWKYCLSLINIASKSWTE